MDSLWALIIPSAMSVYNAIICKTAIEAVPSSLNEAAYLDGANDFQIIFKVVMPLIKPTLAVLLLYYGVGKWNAWYAASIYINKQELMPVQNVIRSIVMEGASVDKVESFTDSTSQYSEIIKYAAIVVTTLPIMCIYPFIQKYFTKGVMIGAVKG